MKTSHFRNAVLTSVGASIATTGLAGCAMPNSSNPTLTIREARVSGESVALQVQIDNPSDMDLQVESATWTLQYGPLPVADGEWALGFVIPKKGTHQLVQVVEFTSPPLDPSAAEVELTGTLDVKTIGNAGNTALRSAGFSATRKTSR